MIAWFASAALAGGAASFPADQFGRSDKTAAQSTGGTPLPEAAEGTDRMEAVFARAPDDVFRQLGRSVGMLDMLVRTKGNLERNDTCTATLIARDRILTNYHCVPGEAGTVTQAWLFLGFLEPPGLPGERFAVDVSAPIEKNVALDYAILAVKGVPDRYPALPVRVGQPSPQQTLYIIHHPLGQKQRLTSLGCQAARPALNTAGDFVHHCDTLGGSSGALVLDQTQAVVALHKRGLMDEEKPYNLGTPMSKIVAASPELQRIARLPVAAAVATPALDIADYGADAAREACEAAARAAGEIEWEGKLDAAARVEAGKATAIWSAAAPKLEPCVSLTSAEKRAQCAGDVEKVIAALRGLRALVPAGPSQAAVQGVSCTVPMAERTRAVAPKELAAAEALLAKLRERSATPATPAAAAPVAGFVRIEPGTFTMGSPSSEAGRDSDEAPHRVTLTGAYWLATAEVTQGEYEALMGSNPARGQGCSEYKGVSLVRADYPVMCVSWLNAVAYANKRSEREGLRPAYAIAGEKVTWDRNANGYRLPTEAEWEYAARAGTTTPWGGPTSREADVCALGNIADATAKSMFSWATTCSDGAAGLTAVRSYRANPWGLYDMVGGVWEWTWDLYAPYGGDVTDPVSATGSSRVYRGGGWGVRPSVARVARRDGYSAGDRYHYLGFRLARSIP